MKISVYATTALAAATSFSCFVSATAAAASRKRKIMKKVGATGQTNSDDIPIGDPCTPGDDNCAIPPGLDHGVCRGGTCKVNIYGGSPPTYCEGYVCQSGQPGSSCGVTTDCVVPPGLDHAVCRKGKCQRWVQQYSVQFFLQSIQCGSTCKTTNLHTAVHIFFFSFYSGVKGDYCGQNNDCQGNMKCHGVTKDAKCR